MHVGLIVLAVPLLAQVRSAIHPLELDPVLLCVVVGIPHPAASTARLEVVTVNQLLH
jgi:hypothetical protein